MRFTAIDFETANREVASACSIGLTKVENGKIVDSASWLIRPRTMYIDPYFTTIHGIREDDVRDKPEFNELWDEIRDYIDDDILIAHSAEFDMGVLRGLYKIYGINGPRYNYNCSCKIARKAFLGLVNYKLNTVASHLGLSFKHHDACEDSYASATIVVEAGKILHTDSVNSLSHKLSLPMGTL